MSLILQIETATTVCSVALAKDGNVLAFKEIDERNIHAEVLNVFIGDLIVSEGLSFNDLDAVAVSCGPGSYTGLRIGVSTAKGLCFALDKPLIAVDTLTAMASGAARQISDQDTLLCPMIDARRMEVYTALFDHSAKMIDPVVALIVDEESFAARLQNNKILFFGDGADKCRGVLGHNPGVQFLSPFNNSAAYLTQIALNRFENKQFEDVAYFEPYYLKDFIAGKKKV
ncbi:MAG: tRNA (adenosine(37)-N6)-threonylcarbamoyltransferase complex dimerization subunit type 1 TsaB [Mucilaginibacter sp.]